MTTRRGWDLGLALLVTVMVVAGCAGRETSSTPLPPTKTLQPGDLPSLAGEWQGTLRGVGTTGPLRDGPPTRA